jgi:C-terminal processing protease CtpA/Prc
VRLELGSLPDGPAAPDQPEGLQQREVAIRAINAGSYRKLRYQEWVHANEAYVHRISDGRLGYVHIPAMTYDAYQQFLSDLDTEAHGKEGLVLDIRFNSGGHTATFFLDVLTRRGVILMTPRGRRPGDAAHLNGSRVLNRPTVLVTNEHTASNAEMMSETYRRLGIGKVVGRPTAGAVIGTVQTRLLDGWTLLVPSLRVTTLEGEDLEGRGRPVDINVAQVLGEAARGRDRQLDAAAEALLAQIDASKREPRT